MSHCHHPTDEMKNSHIEEFWSHEEFWLPYNSCNKYLLSVYCEPGTILSTENIAVKKTDKELHLYEAHIIGWGGKQKTTYLMVLSSREIWGRKVRAERRNYYFTQVIWERLPYKETLEQRPEEEEKTSQSDPGGEQSRHRKHRVQKLWGESQLVKYKEWQKDQCGRSGVTEAEGRPHAVSAGTKGLFAEKENKISGTELMEMLSFRRWI